MPLLQHLARLESSGLIRLAAVQPELEYLFRHALVQDAAYGSLVKQDRRQLHRAVGEALEQLYPERLEEIAPLLAQHFAEAGDAARALHYFTRAGDAAARVYANVEALAHYTRAIEIARRVPSLVALASFPGQTEEGILIHLYTSRGRVLQLNTQFDDALGNYAEMEALAHDRHDRALELAALMARATLHATHNPLYDPAQGRALLEQALALARDPLTRDRAAESKISWNLMILYVYAGHDMSEAIAYGEQSLALARELNLRDQLAFTLNDLFYAYLTFGDMERALAAQMEARDLWRELSNLPMLADNLASFSVSYFLLGAYEQALSLQVEALQINRSIGNVAGQASNLMLVGNVYLERGQPDKAIEIMQEAIRLGEPVGILTTLTGTRADLGWVYGTLGAVEQGIELARLACASAAGEKVAHLLRPWTAAVLARLHLLNGEVAEAEAAVQEAQRHLRPGSFFLGPILVALAETELALAQHDYARTVERADDLLARLSQRRIRPFSPGVLYLKGRALLALGQTGAAEAVLRAVQTEAQA
ncbi:MAG: tetratricopeptide repeat protein, partial [Anaerolineales bacterium]